MRLAVIIQPGIPARVALRAGADEIWLSSQKDGPRAARRERDGILEARELGKRVLCYLPSPEKEDIEHALLLGYSGIVAPGSVLESVKSEGLELVPMESVRLFYAQDSRDLSVLGEPPSRKDERIVIDLTAGSIEEIALVTDAFKRWTQDKPLPENELDRLRAFLGEPIFSGFVLETSGKTLTARLVKPLYEGDVIRLVEKGTTIGEWSVHKTEKDSSRDAWRIVLPPFSRKPDIKGRAEIHLVGSKKPLEQAKNIISRNVTVPVTIRMVARTGKRAVLYVSDGEREHNATTPFEIKDSSRGARIERITQELWKPLKCYEASNVVLDIEPHAGLTVSMVRQLKKEAIEKLSRERRERERVF